MVNVPYLPTSLNLIQVYGLYNDSYGKQHPILNM